MSASVAPISARLDRLVDGSNLRNFRATAKHFDAAGEREFAGFVHPHSEEPYDRFAPSMVEGGICWRDPNAGRA